MRKSPGCAITRKQAEAEKAAFPRRTVAAIMRKSAELRWAPLNDDTVCFADDEEAVDTPPQYWSGDELARLRKVVSDLPSDAVVVVEARRLQAEFPGRTWRAIEHKIQKLRAEARGGAAEMDDESQAASEASIEKGASRVESTQMRPRHRDGEPWSPEANRLVDCWVLERVASGEAVQGRQGLEALRRRSFPSDTLGCIRSLVRQRCDSRRPSCGRIRITKLILVVRKGMSGDAMETAIEPTRGVNVVEPEGAVADALRGLLFGRWGGGVVEASVTLRRASEDPWTVRIRPGEVIIPGQGSGLTQAEICEDIRFYEDPVSGEAVVRGYSHLARLQVFVCGTEELAGLSRHAAWLS